MPCHLPSCGAGSWRTSPVTGKPELYFSSWERLPRYLLSAAVTASLLFCAFSFMILSLNLQVCLHSVRCHSLTRVLIVLTAHFGVAVLLCMNHYRVYQA